MNDRRRNTVRIDYDKLAEAIVKAQTKANEEIKDANPKNKHTNGFLKIFIEVSLWVFIAFGVLFVVGIVLFVIKNLSMYSLSSFEGWEYIVLTVGFLLFSVIVTVYSALTLKDVENSEDTNYLSSMFSNTVALVALIVAAIALIK